MFILQTETGEYFSKVKSHQGQPMAMATKILDNAKTFRSEKQANNFFAKWKNTGVGIEWFKKVVSLT